MNNKDYTAVCFGEVLWDFLPDGAKQPGGVPMNVDAAITSYKKSKHYAS
jgi:hypothetical protein